MRTGVPMWLFFGLSICTFGIGVTVINMMARLEELADRIEDLEDGVDEYRTVQPEDHQPDGPGVD